MGDVYPYMQELKNKNRIRRLFLLGDGEGHVYKYKFVRYGYKIPSFIITYINDSVVLRQLVLYKFTIRFFSKKIILEFRTYFSDFLNF